MEDSNLKYEPVEGQIFVSQPMALEGIRIIDLTMIGAGPEASRLLGQVGAEILKIELPGTGEQYRKMGRNMLPPGTSPSAPPNPVFEEANQNKKSVTIDLHKKKGQEILHRLIEKSDVFISNLLPEALKRLSADYETLVKYNDRLVYARGSVFGPEGPDKNKPGFAGHGNAIGGLMTANSHFSTTGEPIQAGGAAGDTVHALAMAYGVLVALLARNKLGIGQEVTLSQLGVIMNLVLCNELTRCLDWGISPRHYPRNKAPALNNYYRCQDNKWILLAISDDHFDDWYRLCNAIGKPELTDDSRFKSRRNCIENNEVLLKILEEVFLTKTRQDWDASFKKAGVVWYCRINELIDLENDPQVIANKYIWKVNHPKYGLIKMPGHPVTFTKTPATIRSFAPEVGQHTTEVLMDLLGYNQDEIIKLKQEEVI
jgi:CoA:oxalate CoA-transferase